MRFRWTINDLESMTPQALVTKMLDERRFDLNPYAPLSKRINELIKWVDDTAEAAKKLEIAEKFIYQDEDFEEYRAELKEQGLSDSTPPKIK